MADESAVSAPPAPPPQTGLPWLLIAGVLGAAWWWEKKYGKQSIGSVVAGKLLSDDDEGDDEDDDDSEDEDSGAHDVEWTDKPIGAGKHGRKALADMGGPISDTYIVPIKRATQGRCDEAVKLLEKAARQGDQIAGRKKTVVRRALRRAATIVTEKCPKEVDELVGGARAIRDEAELEVDSLRRDEPRSEWRRPDVYHKSIQVVRREHDEGGTRFRRRTPVRPGRSARKLEYRRKGKGAWRVIDTKTGEESIKKVSTGRPRGRPKKLQ